MTAGASSATTEGSITNLVPGTVVGGRFEVERTASEDALGVILAARDQKTGKPISLRVLSRRVLPNDSAIKGLRSECRTAASLSHRNIVATYGMGTDTAGAAFVACEWIDGKPLQHLIADRKKHERRMSLRGAYNVIAHVCKGLTYAHTKMAHGALRPSIVWVGRSGRVKVGDFGVGRAVIQAAGADALGPQEQPCLAPEVKAGGEPNQASDIFGVGAILYEMLTGLSPAEGFVPPSQAHPDATEAVDEVLLKCLAPDPSQRFESPDEVRRTLLPLMAEAPAFEPEQEFGVEVDVDVDLASIRPSQPPGAGQPSGQAAAVPRAPQVPQEQAQAPQQPPAQSAGPAPAQPAQPHGTPLQAAEPQPQSTQQSPQQVEEDLQALLAKITENDAPRWMVVKDNLDHGPFSGRELVELILKGEMLEDHTLLNMDTGERRPMKEWAEFTEFLEQHKIKKQQEEEKAALERSEKVEKRSNVMKILVAAGIFAVLLAGGGVYLYAAYGRTADDEIAETKVADLYEKGEIKIEGSAGILPEPQKRRRRGGGGGGSRSRRSAGGGMSYEQAMHKAVQMNAAESGGQQRLTSQKVASVMNRHVSKFTPCVTKELRGGGSIGKVQIDLAIAGSGKVLGASVRQGSASFKKCIERRVRGIKFPTFSAPRMGARYSFSVE
jgi:serine/threonine protein kinase